MISIDLIKRFQLISHYFNQHAYAQVVELFKHSFSIRQVPVEIALMYAISLRRIGQLEASRESFSAALKLHPTNADLMNAFGNLLLELEVPELAVEQFEQVVKLKPQHADGYLNSARALNQAGLYQKAVVNAEKAYQLKPGDTNIAIALAENLALDGRSAEAESLLSDVLLQHPENIKVLNNLGNLKRRNGELADAIVLLTRAAVGNNATVLRNLAACYALDNQFDHAFNCYQRAIAAAPDDVVAYTEQASLLWQHGADAPFTTIEVRLKANPDHHALRIEYIKILLQLAQPEKAATYLEPLLQQFPDNSSVLVLATTVFRDIGDYAAAERYGRKALQHSTTAGDIAAKSELAYTLLSQHRGAEAAELYLQLCRDDPLNQGWWTTLSTAFKQNNDELQYFWLCDYKLVNVSHISDQSGDSLLPADFNQHLLRLLKQLHCNVRPPLGLSLQNGSQTFENLFERSDVILQQLRQAVLQKAREFISGLSADAAHPFLSRLSAELEFQGSWSVQLKDEGFHKSHFHPMGWLSGVYYVDIPDAVECDGQGWLVFGRPDIPNVSYLGDYAVKPQAGQLVLFPSFMWHGTNPFKSSSHRVTVAFDIVPRKNKTS